jgi:hypothetical protein
VKFCFSVGGVMVLFSQVTALTSDIFFFYPISCYLTCKNVVSSVRKKFQAPDLVSLRFVMLGDGCQIDEEDLADVVDTIKTIMVLCGEDHQWKQVCSTINIYAGF